VTNLHAWAIRWGVPHAALADLVGMMLDAGLPPPEGPLPGKSEAAVQVNVRLEATRAGCRLWRNNVGAGQLADGSFLRWGLANDSKQMNAHIKSADLIGIRPRRVEPHHVGEVWGVFLSREIKPEGWRYSGTDREVAQRRWAELVLALGGDACFATGVGTIDGAGTNALPSTARNIRTP
jgi:hypothetical protein